MSTTVYGSYMNANASISAKYLRPYITYTTTTSDTAVSVTLTAGIHIKANYSSSAKIVFTLSATDHSSSSVTKDNAGWKDDKKYSYFSKTFTWSRTTAAATKAIKLKIKHGDTGNSSTATVSISVPALTKYTVSYDANNGTGAPSAQTYYHGQSLVLTSSIPTYSGYVFDYWNTKADNTGTRFAKGAEYSSGSRNESTTLYAQWHLDTRTITYDANGGSNAPNPVSVNYNNSHTIRTEIPTRTNYLFIGWAISSTATVGTYSNSANGVLISTHSSIISNVTDNMTLYAVWLRTYTIPTVSSFAAYKSNSSGEIVDESVGYFRCDFVVSQGVQWYIENQTLKSRAATFAYVIKYGETDSSDTLTTVSADNGKNSSAFSPNINTTLDGSKKYTVTLTVYPDGDSTNSVTLTEYLSSDVYVFDVNAAGKAIAFGQAAQDIDSSNNQVEGFFMSQDYFDKGNLPDLISNKGDSNGGWHFVNDVEVDGTITVNDALTANNGATVSNGMTVSGNVTAANNLYLTGDVLVPSTSTLKYQTPLTVSSGTPAITRTAGTTVANLNAAYSKWGRIVQLHFMVYYSTSVGSGKDIFTGTLTTANLRPIMSSATGVGYYGARSIVMRLQSSGAIVIRNASSDSVTLDDSPVYISLTYISAS